MIFSDPPQSFEMADFLAEMGAEGVHPMPDSELPKQPLDMILDTAEQAARAMATEGEVTAEAAAGSGDEVEVTLKPEDDPRLDDAKDPGHPGPFRGQRIGV